MKTFLTSKLGIGIILSLILAVFSVSYANAEGVDPNNIDPNDMERVQGVTVWFYNGSDWQELSGVIFRHKTTGQKYIRVRHRPTNQRGLVQSNKDYTGGVEGGKRTLCEYMTKCDNGITYYFNM